MKYFLAFALTIVLASCSTENGNKDSAQTKASPSSLIVKQGANYTETLKEVSGKIKEAPEFNSCMQSNIAMCVQSSAMQIARNNKSADFCEELKNDGQKESCKFAIIMTDVQEKGDVKLCEKLSGTFLQTCISQGYRMMAINTKDISLCQKIPTGEAASGSVIKGRIGNNDQGQCIMNVIMSNPDAKEADCKKINDTTLATMCSNTIKQRANRPQAPIRPVPKKQ